MANTIGTWSSREYIKLSNRVAGMDWKASVKLLENLLNFLRELKCLFFMASDWSKISRLHDKSSHNQKS